MLVIWYVQKCDKLLNHFTIHMAKMKQKQVLDKDRAQEKYSLLACWTNKNSDTLF